MSKFFYEWEDASDPYATGVPDLGRYAWARCRTKAAVRKEWGEYTSSLINDKAKRVPRLRVWRISYEEVKV